MPLQPTSIDFPLAIGLDTKTDKKLARGLLELENGVVDKTGAIKKRPGLRRLAGKNVVAGGLSANGAATLVEGHALYDFRGSPVVFGRSQFKNTSGLETVASGWRYHLYENGLWRPVGEAAPIGFQYKPLIPAAADANRVTFASIGSSKDYLVCAYYDVVSTNIYAMAFTLDGAFVAKKTVDTLASVSGLHCFGFSQPNAFGHNNFSIVYGNDANIYMYTWNPGTDASVAATDVGDINGGLSTAWSACYARDSGGLSNGPDAVIVFDGVAAGYRGRMRWFTAGSVTARRTVNLANVSTPHQTVEIYCPPRVAANYTSDPYVRILYLKNAAAFFTFEEYTADGATTVTAKALTAGADPLRMGELPHPWASTDEKQVLIALGAVYEAVGLADENALPTTTREGANYIIPRMFTLGGELYVPVYEAPSITGTQNTLFLRSLRRTLDSAVTQQSYVAGALLLSEAGALEAATDPRVFWGNPSYLEDGRVIIPARRIVRLPIAGSVKWFSQETGMVILEHKPAPASFVNVGEGLILAGSITGWFDGQFQELGFHLNPATPGSISTPAGGQLSAATSGLYSFRVAWQWVDRLGNEFRSAVSLANTATAAALDKATWSQAAIPFSHPGRKRSTTRIVSYRTTEAGSTHYEEGAVDDTTAEPDLMPTDAQGTTTVRGGVISDTNLVANAVMPLDAGELEPSPVPGAKLVFIRRDRTFLVPMDHPTHLWPSKPLEAGRGPEFSIDQVLVFEKGGDITAGICQDDNVILFKDSSIVVFGGEGPNALGQGSFTTPRDIASDVGAENQNGVVQTRIGTIFKSKKGWFLIDRSLQVDNSIGLPIDRYKDRTVLASLLLESRDEVVILLSGGTVLALDLTQKIWQTRTLPQEMAHAALVGGVLHFLGKDGTVWKEDPTVTHDEGSRYPLRLGTPFFKPSPLPETRIWRVGILGDLGDRDFVFKAKLYYDYNATTAVQEILLDTRDAQIDEEGNLFLELTPARTRAQSIKLVLEDVDGQGENFALSSLTLDLGVAKRLGRQRPGRRG